MQERQRSRDMLYCILASKLPSQNKNKNLPPDHKISEKGTLTNYYFFAWPMNDRLFTLQFLRTNKAAFSTVVWTQPEKNNMKCVPANNDLKSRLVTNATFRPLVIVAIQITISKFQEARC